MVSIKQLNNIFYSGEVIQLNVSLPTDKTRSSSGSDWQDSFWYTYQEGFITIDSSNEAKADLGEEKNKKIAKSNVTISGSNVTVTIPVASFGDAAYDRYIKITLKVKDDDSSTYSSYNSFYCILPTKRATSVSLTDSDWSNDSTGNSEILTFSIKLDALLFPSVQGNNNPFWTYFNKMINSPSAPAMNIEVLMETADSQKKTLATVNLSFKENGSKIGINSYSATTETLTSVQAIPKMESEGLSIDFTFTNTNGKLPILNSGNITKLIFVFKADRNITYTSSTISVPANVPVLYLKKKSALFTSYKTSVLGNYASVVIDNSDSNASVKDNLALIQTSTKNQNVPSIGLYKGTSDKPSLYFQIYISESEAAAWKALI